MWLDLAVSSVLRDWKSYGCIGDYKFKDFKHSRQSMSGNKDHVYVVTFNGENSDVEATLTLLVLETKGIVKVDLSVSEGYKRVLSASDDFLLEEGDLDDIKKGEYGDMSLSLVTFLVHGGRHMIVT